MLVQKKVWMYGTCKRWWGDPGYRVPTGRRYGKQGGTCLKQTGTVQTRASHTTCIRPRVIVSAVIPLKRAFSERIKFVEGSSGTRAVVEVAVLAKIVEVVVHVRLGEVLDESNVFGATVVEVVVHAAVVVHGS